MDLLSQNINLEKLNSDLNSEGKSLEYFKNIPESYYTESLLNNITNNINKKYVIKKYKINYEKYIS
jgi:hypothetical protein